jgi:hypothetical protein
MRSLYHRFVFAIFLIKAMRPIGYCLLSTVSLRHLIRGIALYGITDRVKKAIHSGAIIRLVISILRRYLDWEDALFAVFGRLVPCASI